MDNISAASPHTDKIKWAYTALTAIVVWFALVLQFCISVPAYQAAGYTLGGSIAQLLSFFTILSNLLVVLSLTVILVKPKSSWGRFFSKNTVLIGIAVYINVVAVVYSLVLRQLWHPQGLFKLADELMHTINPLLFIIYWLTFVPKDGLKWKHALPLLWFPFIYLIYILIRGAISGDYPYPFVDAAKSGYVQVMVNSLVLLLVFLGFGLLYILTARLLTKTAKAITTA